MSRPVAIAITGGIGAGKSEALEAFGKHGAATISSDEIVHELLKRADIRQTIIKHFGSDATSQDGEIDRSALAQIVFSDREALHWLEQLLHPLVSKEYLAWRERSAKLPRPPQLCVTEVPLLYEGGSEKQFDYVVAITAPKNVRQLRYTLMGDQREQRLLAEEEKISRADYSYKNTGSLKQLDIFVESVMGDLKLLEREPVKNNG